jgi:predicted tellurium resistance membrane protein TerC
MSDVFASLSHPDAWIALFTLTAMEIVLGIDNIIFISILVGRTAPENRERLRKLGLVGALVTRILLLLSLKWIMGLTAVLFSVAGLNFTGRSLILLGGGAFLIWKSVREIHDKLEGDDVEHQAEHSAERSAQQKRAFAGLLVQILAVDVIFSLDSVITAVGMAEDLWVMVAAMIISVLVMLAASGAIARFVDAHPTIKILALSFLILIGVLLVAEGLGQHVSKGYVYFAMAFALVVEVLNMRYRKKTAPAAPTPTELS